VRQQAKEPRAEAGGRPDVVFEVAGWGGCRRRPRSSTGSAAPPAGVLVGRDDPGRPQLTPCNRRAVHVDARRPVHVDPARASSVARRLGGQDVFRRAFAAAFPAGTERAIVVGGALFDDGPYAAGLALLASSLGIAGRVEPTGSGRGRCEPVTAL